MQFNKDKKLLIPIFLLILTIFTRFCFLNWGNDFFFNPDENNMATSVAQMSFENLHPNFFAYGQFPLFLTFFTTFKHDFSSIVLTMRFWSALFSSLSILFFYLIAKNIFSLKKIAYLFALLLIFTPGLIQSAHFGTTESILIFVFSVNIYLSLNYLKNQKKIYLFFSILISALGLASKITAVFFVLPIYLSLFLVLLKNKKFLNFILSSIIFTFLFLLLSILFSPFNLIDFSNFKSTMIYETSIATGQSKVFYTRQFENTIPYIFQFKNIFPYANGIFIYLFSFIGFIIFILNTKKLISTNKNKLLIILFPSVIYFLYSGQLFIKWSRFMSPLFFIGSFFCLYFIKKIKNNYLTFVLVMLMISPGIYFVSKYFKPDNRVVASSWINSNIPLNSYVFSESGNVVNIPISNSKINVNHFDFYNNQNQNDLLMDLFKSDYIIIPSRRVFKNQNNKNYPLSFKYYQNLFSGKLGFQEIKKFNNQKDFILNSENAEETWSVFDNPTIRIYKKINNLTYDDYQKIFSNN